MNGNRWKSESNGVDRPDALLEQENCRRRIVDQVPPKIRNIIQDLRNDPCMARRGMRHPIPETQAAPQ
jgi:hypothetical protein